MTATTLAQEILRRYLALKEEVEREVGVFPLPKIPEELSISDFVIMVCYFFSSGYGGDDPKGYRPALRKGMALKRVTMTDEELEKIYPQVSGFLDWLIPELKK